MALQYTSLISPCHSESGFPHLLLDETESDGQKAHGSTTTYVAIERCDLAAILEIDSIVRRALGDNIAGERMQHSSQALRTYHNARQWNREFEASTGRPWSMGAQFSA